MRQEKLSREVLQAVEARCAEQVKWTHWDGNIEVKGVLSKCSDIDGEHIDSEGIEVEGGDGDIDLDDWDNNLDNSAL